jgi:hypothetical protein
MPRVAVHQANGTVFAYKVGNVIDGHHNVDLLTGAVTPVEQIVTGLVSQAQKEFPHDAIVVEELSGHDWVPQESEDKSASAPKQEAPKPSGLLAKLQERNTPAPETATAPKKTTEEDSEKPEEAKAEEPTEEPTNDSTETGTAS